MSKPLSLRGRTILQVIPALNAGGAERTAIDVAAALAHAGARALVATDGGRLLPELEKAGGEAISLPLKTKNPYAILRNAGAIERLIREQGVDLVHARSRAPGWSAYLAARRAGVPFVTTYHGLYNQKGPLKSFYNSVMARGEVVIANSHFTKAAIVARHGVPGDRVAVVYRGTDFARLDPDADLARRTAAMRAEWDAPESRSIVLLPARYTTLKGHEVFIRAAARVKEAVSSPPLFVLAGDGEGREHYLRELAALAASLGVSAEVRLAGHVSDMAAAYAASAIVVSASTQPETFGRVAVEAQAMRKPVIVTRLGAVAETVLAPPRVEAEERTGWHVPPADPAALADAVMEVLAMNDDELALVGAQARAHVLKNFSLEVMTGATLDIYRRLLEGRRLQPVAGTGVS